MDGDRRSGARRRGLLVAALVAGAALLLLLRRRGDEALPLDRPPDRAPSMDERAPLPRPAPTAEPEFAATAAAAAAAAAPPADRAAPVVERAPVATAAAPDAATAPRSREQPLAGTFVVMHERDDDDEAVVHGSFLLHFDRAAASDERSRGAPRDEIEARDAVAPPRRVECDGGTFRTTIPRGCSLRVDDARCGGELVVVDHLLESETPELRTLHVTAYRPATTGVEVVDGESGQPLHGIAVTHGPRLERVAEGSAAIVARDATSPVDLAASRRSSRARATSGRAQERFRFSADARHAAVVAELVVAERTRNVVALPPGGTLDVRFEPVAAPNPEEPALWQLAFALEAGDDGDERLAAAKVREDAIDLTPDELAAGRAVVPALRCGRWRVDFMTWARPDRRVAVASGVATVDAGRTTIVALDATAAGADAAARATCAGRLFVPPEWNDGGAERRRSFLVATDLDDRSERVRSQLEAIDDAPGWSRFSFPQLRVGQRRLLLQPLGVVVTVAVAPGGSDDVVLELPPPARVDVVLRPEEEHGEPPARAWLALVADGCVLCSTDVAPAATRLLPIGDFDLDLRGDGITLVAPRHVRLAAGRSSLELVVRRAAFVELALECDGVPLAIHVDALAAIAVTDPRDGARAESDGDLRWRLARGGRAHVVFPPIAGFEAVEPFDLDVADGSTTRRVVELVRRR